MTIVAFIPARRGSERLADKNLAKVGGHSLVSRACRCAYEAGCDQVIVSTDSYEIACEGSSGPYHHRPPSLSGPRSQIEEALGHWMRRSEPVLDDADVVCLLQPTSPFRKPETVRECVRLVRAGYDSVTTVTLDGRNTGRLRSHADGTPKAIWDRPITSRPRSQDARQQAVENGCVWAFSVVHFRRWKLRQGGHEAVVVTSWLEALEIDTAADLEAARALVGVVGV